MGQNGQLSVSGNKRLQKGARARKSEYVMRVCADGVPMRVPYSTEVIDEPGDIRWVPRNGISMAENSKVEM